MPARHQPRRGKDARKLAGKGRLSLGRRLKHRPRQGQHIGILGQKAYQSGGVLAAKGASKQLCQLFWASHCAIRSIVVARSPYPVKRRS